MKIIFYSFSTGFFFFCFTNGEMENVVFLRLLHHHLIVLLNVKIDAIMSFLFKVDYREKHSQIWLFGGQK